MSGGVDERIFVMSYLINRLRYRTFIVTLATLFFSVTHLLESFKSLYYMGFHYGDSIDSNYGIINWSYPARVFILV